jgi:hypothetical protein
MQGVISMSSLFSLISSFWARFFNYLTERNERAVAAWGSSLQYKRRYTNPDDAKRFRRSDLR